VSRNRVEIRDAYLARLGLGVEPPSADALFALHRAQVERVPYETLWIHLGHARSVDPVESMRTVATTRGGGYCFHLNGAFSELLTSLGYDVVRHVGAVHGPGGVLEEEIGNHLVLTVHGLPTDDNPDGVWYVDAGLGDALHEPLPLRAGAHRQPPFDLVLERTTGGFGDWHLVHDASGGFTGMAWSSQPTTLDAFTRQHQWLSTSPDSGFVKVLTVQRRDDTGVDVLRGLAFQRLGQGARSYDVASRDELVALLAGPFGMDVSAIDPATVDDLWTRLEHAHRKWVAAGRP
jgi:N-hydroxyarylamine O-acetyltransferase